MIKRINKIKNLGVFSNYIRNSEIRDFEEKNIIYGWNYSGKTTISRLFSYLDKNEPIDEDYKTVEFEIELADGKKITNENRSESRVMIKVFNSDFIKNNLHFDSYDEERKITGIKFAVGDTGNFLDQIRIKEKYIEKAKSVIEHISPPISVFNSVLHFFLLIIIAKCFQRYILRQIFLFIDFFIKIAAHFFKTVGKDAPVERHVFAFHVFSFRGDNMQFLRNG